MANENMIQKHVDNFLAEIAGGVTPVDLNPRDSKEFWLKEIAKWTEGKSTDDASTKKIYYHPIAMYNEHSDAYRFVLSFIIINNDPDSYATPTALKTAISDFDRVAPLNGPLYDVVGNKVVNIGYSYKSGTIHKLYGMDTTGTFFYPDSINLEMLIDQTGTVIRDSVNAIN